MPLKGISPLDFEAGSLTQATSPLDKLPACCACPLHCKRWSDPQRLYPSQYRLLRDKVAENQYKWRKATANAQEAEERAKELEGRIDLCKEETAQAKDEEIRAKTRRIQMQDEEIGRKDERIRLMDEEIRRMSAEIWTKDEEIRMNVREIHAIDEYRRKDNEAGLLSQRCKYVEQNLDSLRAENASLRQKIYVQQKEHGILSKELEVTKDILGAKDRELIEARATLSSKQTGLPKDVHKAFQLMTHMRQKLHIAEKEAQRKVFDVEEEARQKLLETEGKAQELTKELAASREAETRTHAGHERAVEQLISQLEEVRRVAAEREKEIERLGVALKEVMSQGRLVSDRCRELEMRPPPADESHQRRLEEERSIAMATLKKMNAEMSIMKEAGMQLIVENQSLSGEIERLQGWKVEAWTALEQREVMLRDMEGDLIAARESARELMERNRILATEVDGLRFSTDMTMEAPSDSDAVHLSQMTSIALAREAELIQVKEELARSLEREKKALENCKNLHAQEPQKQSLRSGNDVLHRDRYDRLVEVIDLIKERIDKANYLSIPITDLDLSHDIAFLDLQVRLDAFEDIQNFESIPWPISSGIKVVEETMQLEWEENEKNELSFLERFSGSLSFGDSGRKPKKPPTWEKELPLFLEGFSESLCPQAIDIELDYLARIQQAFDMDMWARKDFMQKSKDSNVREMGLLVSQAVDRVMAKAMRKQQLKSHS
ncbi:uncharacterized protein EV420DRAFT_387332 [Desarmillaria tabescens]|uniref:Uncharacterized protein n=1 Tax=Armillaria tabescens TaxID=1929756 RepID=A0AA39KE64_ARMTA|nr:uncharacterized protein EV420DRAFT_387332 [Desarmillaria tabescens]KAK0458246.1 hypothetical protein EV420DRAFT_387332 [Desarmillaria tabescens]